MADGAVDMDFNIRLGRPFPVRSFPDLEAAKAYVLNGLDVARAHLHRHEHLHRVADGVHDIRLLVAADRVPAAMAASAELRALAAEARQMQMRRAFRLTVVLSLLACFLVMANLIVPFLTPALAFTAPALVFQLLPRSRMQLALGVLCIFPTFAQAIAAALLLYQVWQCWCIDAAVEAERLREGERVAVVVTERTVAAVDNILYRLLN